MEFIELLKDLLRILAVTALPAGLIWWWNCATHRAKNDFSMYFWMVILAIGMIGVGYELLSYGSISSPNIQPGYQ